jgi:hypothetical protein
VQCGGSDGARATADDRRGGEREEGLEELHAAQDRTAG